LTTAALSMHGIQAKQAARLAATGWLQRLGHGVYVLPPFRACAALACVAMEAAPKCDEVCFPAWRAGRAAGRVMLLGGPLLMHFQSLWSMGYHVVFRNVVLLVSRVGVTNLTTQNTAVFSNSLIFNAFLACGSCPISHPKPIKQSAPVRETGAFLLLRNAG